MTIDGKTTELNPRLVDKLQTIAIAMDSTGEDEIMVIMDDKNFPADHRYAVIFVTGHTTPHEEIDVMVIVDDINFPAGHRYAVIDVTGHTTHETTEDTITASMANEQIHEIIDSNGEKYLVVHYDTGTRLTKL